MSSSSTPAGPRLYQRIRLGTITAEYWLDEASGTIGLTLLPASRPATTERRTWLEGHELAGYAAATHHRFRAWGVDSLIQIKAVGDDYAAGFASGRTMRNGETLNRLKFDRQEVLTEGTARRVRTWLRHENGWKARHDLVASEGAIWLESSTTIENTSVHDLILESLSSFSLSGITPYAADDAPDRLRLHRFRSVWSAEARLESLPFEQLQLERSWTGHAVRCERFGTVGSLPNNGFSPCAAIEDIVAGVTWAASLAQPGSWQMEIYRRDDCVDFSGGLGDREFGHWMKTLAPGHTFTTPRAYVTCVAGGLDDACANLTAAHAPILAKLPASESELPVMFNEWSTTWGKPTEAGMDALARSLRGTGVRYLTIDAGWYAPADGNWSTAHGDWIPSQAAFPAGLAATAAAIRAQGLIPGLWFEFETAGPTSELYRRTELFLHRDGLPLTIGGRRFLDFRIPQVISYLADRVIRTLRDNGFGYLKVDYNETIGIGADGAESPGEALREHLAGVQRFFAQLRVAIPDLVVENCSSGGHRIEPSYLALTAMSSFSDAHECTEIPIIAANLHRLCQPRQSQIWAVLHPTDSMQRLTYSLAAGFLGRLCLSGDYLQLSSAQRGLVQQAIDLYALAAPAIKAGRSYRHGPTISSYRHAEGWQAVVRLADQRDQAVIVGHCFAAAGSQPIRIPLPPGNWELAAALGDQAIAGKIVADHWECHRPTAWSGFVAVLKTMEIK